MIGGMVNQAHERALLKWRRRLQGKGFEILKHQDIALPRAYVPDLIAQGPATGKCILVEVVATHRPHPRKIDVLRRFGDVVLVYTRGHTHVYPRRVGGA